jgi:hypothetical protein
MDANFLGSIDYIFACDCRIVERNIVVDAIGKEENIL